MKKIVELILLIILLFGGIFLINKFFKTKQVSNDSNVVQQIEEEENTVIEEKPKDSTMHMTVAGDVICHNSNYKDAYDSKTDTYDFSYSFADIEKYFKDADIVIGTLETNFAGKEAGYSNYPRFNSPEHLATDLKELGFDILVTAQNHCLDTGYSGLVKTLEELDKNGIEHTGTYSSEESSKEYLIKDINGIKTAFLNYTYGTNGIPIPKGKEYAVNLIDKEKMKSDIENVKAQGVDLICVNMHWGIEYKLQQNSEQEDLADFLFENGVDVILGSHPHCVEPMEKRTITLEDGTTKDGFIIYSIGNFMSGQNQANTRQSAIFDIYITKHGDTGKITIDSVKYTPTYMYNYYNSKVTHKYKIMDIEEEIAKYEAGDTSIGASLYNTLKKELANIYEVLGDEIISDEQSEE